MVSSCMHLHVQADTGHSVWSLQWTQEGQLKKQHKIIQKFVHPGHMNTEGNSRSEYLLLIEFSKAYYFYLTLHLSVIDSYRPLFKGNKRIS